MNEWKKQSEKLLDVIKDSSEYKNYKIYMEKIQKKENIYQKVSDYRRESFELQVSDKEKWLGSGDDLLTKYEDVLVLPEVKEYLLAEVRLCKMIRSIWEMIYGQIDLDIDFLD